MEGYIGEVRAFAGNFNPKGWAICDGSALQISENQALFAILGTVYGGDGVTDFCLPDLRGRVLVGVGQGLGLTNWGLGDAGGTETTTNVPIHTHAILNTDKVFATPACLGDSGGSSSPVNNISANVTNGYSATTDADNLMAPIEVNMSQVQIQSTGIDSVSLIQPSLALNWIICVVGIFPSRD